MRSPRECRKTRKESHRTVPRDIPIIGMSGRPGSTGSETEEEWPMRQWNVVVPWQPVERVSQAVGSDQLVSYWLSQKEKNWQISI
jgi:hypothetical protein